MSETLEIGVNEGERQRNRLNALGVVNDLHPRLDELRDQGDVHAQSFSALMGQPEPPSLTMNSGSRYAVLGFESGDAAFRQHDVFSSSGYQATTSVWGPNILAMDSPEHRRYRSLAQPAFASRTMEDWEKRWLSPILDELIARIRSERSVELYMAYCARFPAHTIASSFGIDGSDVEEVHDMLLRMLDQTDPEGAGRAAVRIKEILGGVIEQRRAEPRDDIISLLAASELVEEDGSRHTLSDPEILGFAGLMLTAGSGTTYRTLGVLLLALLQRSALWDRLVEDRSLVPQVVEEAIRWDPPLTMFSRLTTRDTELAGVEIPGGSVVDVVVTAANHDPRRWDDPHAFDPFRPLIPHLSFASGPHFCIGNQLARMELRVALERLLDAFPGMRLDPDAPEPYITGLLFRMPTALPVLLDG